MRALNPVFAARPMTIFAVMTALAREHGAINLGQGFPDEDGPEPILKAASNALLRGPNQYAPVHGVQELREAVARANARFYGLGVDWNTQTLVVSGATEGLAAAFLAFLEPGDEAILIAPCYDSYAPMIEAAGAAPRFVRLSPPDWRLDEAALRAAITPRTKVIAVNSPHNPTGAVLSRAELEMLAAVIREHGLIAVCDEVYEHLLFDGRRHIPLMTLPGMLERCIRIGSAGKTFSLTGWRIGYVTGPPRLIDGVAKAHQYIAYSSPSHLQLAIAQGIELDDGYYAGFTAGMERKRDQLRAALEAAGLSVLPCEGTYFMLADIRSVGADDDAAFCRMITQEAKVAAVPVSAFYPAGDEHAPRSFARFCFCKKSDVLSEAGRRLKAYFGK